jgi:hypothetical protein
MYHRLGFSGLLKSRGKLQLKISDALEDPRTDGL